MRGFAIALRTRLGADEVGAQTVGGRNLLVSSYAGLNEAIAKAPQTA
jgi:hypothetical protein